MVIMTQYCTLEDAALEEEFNTVTLLHTKDMIMTQVGGVHSPGAVTPQTRFIRLAVDVTFTKTCKNIVKYSVNLTKKYTEYIM